MSGGSGDGALAGPMIPAVGALAPAAGGAVRCAVASLDVAELAGAVPVNTVNVPPVRFGGGLDATAVAGALAPMIAARPGGRALAVASDTAADDASGAGVPGITTVAGVGTGASSRLLQPATAIVVVSAAAIPTFDKVERWICMSVLEAASVLQLAIKVPVGSIAASRAQGLPISRAIADGVVGPTNRRDLVDKSSDSLHGAAGAVPGRAGFDTLIVGAGFAGSVMAERLANELGQRVLIVDKRPHIGGNAYDRYDDAGVLIHPYGPHIFHTNAVDIFDYLSRFTEWRPYQHRVLASVDGQEVPMPINLDTVNMLYGLKLTSFEMQTWFDSVAEKKETLLTSEDAVVSKVGRELYNKFFRGYTRKQWGLDPSELDASVTSRVPTRTNRDDRYFADTFQAIPKHGYTRMFEKMLSHPNIKVMLNTDYREVADLLPWKHMVYSGPIDEFFNHRHGKLPYRSLEFKHVTLDQEQYQAVGTVNYPNDYAYTRISEFKHITGQKHPSTSIVYEFPKAEGDPYYPVPRKENAELYRLYEAEAEQMENVTFVGRLATYKYYNMDQVVGQSLAAFRRLQKRWAETASQPASALDATKGEAVTV